MVAEISFIDRIIDVIVNASSPQEILALKATPEESNRLRYLLDRNRQGILSTAEEKELDLIFMGEHFAQVAKAKGRELNKTCFLT